MAAKRPRADSKKRNTLAQRAGCFSSNSAARGTSPSGSGSGTTRMAEKPLVTPSCAASRLVAASSWRKSQKRFNLVAASPSKGWWQRTQTDPGVNAGNGCSLYASVVENFAAAWINDLHASLPIPRIWGSSKARLTAAWNACVCTASSPTCRLSTASFSSLSAPATLPRLVWSVARSRFSLDN